MENLHAVNSRSPTWQAAKSRLFGIAAAPCFDAIREGLNGLAGDEWPSLDVLNRLAAQRALKNARGLPLRFASADLIGSMPQHSPHYESRIAETGQILTRDNWHDLFNALQWLAFPQAKAAISEMHTRLLAANESEVKARSIPRDVLTLFDEGGIIVASTDASLLDLVRKFQWRTLFVERREDVKTHMHFHLAGHSVLEKMLNPFIGITAKSLLINIENTTLDERCTLSNFPPVLELDGIAAEWLMNADNRSTTRNLHPLPILGIPGWDIRNESPSFYDDTHYFRVGRMNDR